MKKVQLAICIVLAFFLIHSGCAAKQKVLTKPHDEVLVYPLPFDLVYLRTMEALENVAGWELEETEKEKGVIIVRNIDHASMDDIDQLRAIVWLKRIDRGTTSIELAPQSQRTIGGETLLQRIGEYVSKEIV